MTLARPWLRKHPPLAIGPHTDTLTPAVFIKVPNIPQESISGEKEIEPEGKTGEVLMHYKQKCLSEKQSLGFSRAMEKQAGSARGTCQAPA